MSRPFPNTVLHIISETENLSDVDCYLSPVYSGNVMEHFLMSTKASHTKAEKGPQYTCSEVNDFVSTTLNHRIDLTKNLSEI